MSQLDPQQDEPATDVHIPAPEMDLAAAHARIAELETKLAEATDKALRALAEAENTRRRAERERQDTAKFSVSSFARDILPVADNLRRALQAVTAEQLGQNEQLKNIHTGVEATERELLRALESNSIKKIDPLDQKFDPNLHEVVFEAEMPNKAPGTIIQVIEPGYTIHERLLRPARVGIAKGGENGKSSYIDQEV